MTTLRHRNAFVSSAALGMLMALAMLGAPTAARSAGEKVLYSPASTEKVCQLTGGLGTATVGISGTDLGYPFEHRSGSASELVFLFGDTIAEHGEHPFNLDAVAFSADRDPGDCVDLSFVTESGNPNLYHPPDITYPDGVPPITEGTQDGRALVIPSHGFSANTCPEGTATAGSERIYAFFSSFSDAMVRNPLRSILTYSCDRGRTFHYLHDASRQHFINGSSLTLDNAAVPGLPRASGPGLLVWGSGEYRESDVYLAFVPLDRVEDRGSWRYYREPTVPGQNPWVTQESFATPVLRAPRSADSSCVGELSITWNPFLHKWLALYNCNRLSGPSEVRFHVADLPWGPWSPFLESGPGGSTTIVFQPERDGAFGSFIHRAGHPDSLNDTMFGQDRYDEWGDPYGPYVISRYTTGDTRSTTIYYTLSTWNPYQVTIMRSTLRLQRPPMANAGLDKAAVADARCMAQVTLDGTRSSDPDGDPLTYTWRGPFGTVTGPTPTVTVPLGTSTITLTVDDGLGGSATDQVDIVVRDTAPPSLGVVLTPNTLWAPRHHLVRIDAAIETRDNCDPSPAVRLTSITSDEQDNGLGDGDTANDVQGAELGTDDRAFLLRAERSGLSTGRIYTVSYRAEDQSGNGTTAASQVTVPHG